MKKDSKYMLILNTVSYVGVIVVNLLAQLGILNGMTTSEVSDKYVSLFTPAGITFSIWGLIYILLGAYVIYQFIAKDKTTIYRIAPLFFFTNMANIVWILVWHYSSTIMSLLVILVLLFFLMLIVKDLKEHEVLIKTTFSIYYAWITVASIASFFVYLVSIIDAKYDNIYLLILANFALALVGLLMVTGRKNRNLPYILTLIWSVIGIMIKHLSTSGFNGQYLSIIIVGGVVLVFGLVMVISLFMGYKKGAKTNEIL